MIEKFVYECYNLIKQIVSNNTELLLCENGDFKINKSLVDKYEIIDMHCHLYNGLLQLFPTILQQERYNDKKSLMDMSCFPFSMRLFDLDKIYFTGCPSKLCSIDGMKARIKLFSGALVLNYATEERLLKDMNVNNIQKAVVQQINPPGKSSSKVMDAMVKRNDRLYTFTFIHPYDKDIHAKIDRYMSLDIKGWKLNLKNKRIFVGIIIMVDEHQYCIPLSSIEEKSKYQNMSNNITFRKITNKAGEVIGVLNINNMIPVRDEYLIPFNIEISLTDNEKQRKYKDHCMEELEWCNEHENEIIMLARELHRMVCNNQSFKKRSVCPDYRLLEKECDKAKQL